MTPDRWRQIETLYHAARERPAEERAAFLAAACQADEALRREVEQLLGQTASNAGFLAGRPPAIAAGLTAHMPMTGRTLGAYQVEALIGVGGMGEVYRARDAKLGRAVAIKVLPQAFTSDPARLVRFDREARTLAALNHPNICAIYGFEEAESVRFLILEFVDGEALSDRLVTARARSGGPGLPEREALNIARQIARALDFAHERGIVHRDLKPANIKITADGAVKVLDFGLAKAAAGDSAGADLAPVLRNTTEHGTMEGTLLGTPAYMSPEQARGQAVDKRADIWAFGCVLYEMLTGRVAFSADTAADTIARVLEREPDWTALPAATPEPIRNLLLGCLAKDPRERLRDIGDVRITIDSILSGSSGATLAPPASRSPGWRAGWLPWLVIAALVTVLAGMVLSSLKRPPPALVRRWQIEVPAERVLDGSGGAHIVTVSHDDTLVAYVASRSLNLRPTNSAEAKPIPGTELYPGVREPVFSPNGQEIAFYALGDQELKRMPVTGGPPQRICEADTPTGVNWSPNGIILFGQGRNGIWRIQASGGLATQVATVKEDEEAHGPQLLPDGDHFLFTIATGRARDRWNKAQIFVQSLSNPGDRRRLNITGSDARYLSAAGTDYLVYAVGGSVYGIAFDLGNLTVRGDPALVQEGVSRAAGSFTGAANFSVSDAGTFYYVPGPASGAPARMEVALINLGTKHSDVLKIPPAAYDSLRVSPNERRIAFGKGEDKEWTIYTYGLSGGSSDQRLTTAGSNNRYPTWTRNSERLAFQSDREGDYGIWWQAVDGPRGAERLTIAADGEVHIPESWFGDTLLYSVTKRSRTSLWTLTLRNGKPGTSRPFGRSVSTDPMSAVFSPNGQAVAYTLTERSTPTICIEPFPAGEYGCLPPGPGDSPKHPRWSPDGRRVYYDPRLGSFGSVGVRTNPVLGFEEPRDEAYHPFQLSPPGSRTPYDITKSGQILGLTIPGQNGYQRQLSNKIEVVQNWFEVLKEKIPR